MYSNTSRYVVQPNFVAMTHSSSNRAGIWSNPKWPDRPTHLVEPSPMWAETALELPDLSRHIVDGVPKLAEPSRLVVEVAPGVVEAASMLVEPSTHVAQVVFPRLSDVALDMALDAMRCYRDATAEGEFVWLTTARQRTLQQLCG